MMNLMRENEENKRRMMLSVLCGAITIIAVCALAALAAFAPLPAAARIALLLLALATAAAGVFAAAMLDVQAGYHKCPHCGALFAPTFGEYAVKAYHTITRRRLTCPHCGERACAENSSGASRAVIPEKCKIFAKTVRRPLRAGFPELKPALFCVKIKTTQPVWNRPPRGRNGALPGGKKEMQEGTVEP